MIRITLKDGSNSLKTIRQKCLSVLTIMALFFLSSNTIVANETISDEVISVNENYVEGLEAFSYLKCLTFINDGNCELDIYKQTYYGYCIVKRGLKPGERWGYNSYACTSFKVVNANAVNFNRLKYNYSYKVNYNYRQTVRVNPDYCVDQCDTLKVDAGEAVSICKDTETTLTAMVTGSGSCTTTSESDCNHTLYKNGGAENWCYPHTNAAFCGNGYGAKFWTAGGYGTSFVILDFGKTVPAGTKIHTKMKLAHCSSTYSNKSNASILASENGDWGYTTIGNPQFSSQNYMEYTYTLAAPARFIQVVDNGECGFFVDYVRYETTGSTNSEIKYEWAGPGIVGGTNEETIKVNKSGTYTVTVSNCANCSTTDTVEVKINESPKASAVSTNTDCGKTSGSIKFTFEDSADRTSIKLSIDGGLTFTTVPDNSGSYVFNNLAPGTYKLRTQWGNDDCPAELDDVVIIENSLITVNAGVDQTVCYGDSATLTAVVTGAEDCSNCVDGYSAENTDYCPTYANHNFVSWIKFNGIKRWYSNVDLVFKENTDGTATLKGTMKDYFYSNSNYEVDVIYSGYTGTVPPADSPKEHECDSGSNSTTGWRYYTAVTGTITKEDGTETFTISRRGPSFQIGNGANTFEKEPNKYGASGWFTPKSNGVTGDGDFNFNIGDCVSTQSTGIKYLWSTGETTPSIKVTPRNTKTYTVEVSGCGDCSATDEVTVIVNNVTVNAGSDQTIDEGNSTTLSVVNPDPSIVYTWSTGQIGTSITVAPSATTTYTVMAEKDGCKNTDTVVVTVIKVDTCTVQQFQVTAYPNPVDSRGVLKLDIKLDRDQNVTYSIFTMGDPIYAVGPYKTICLKRGCNLEIPIDLNSYCNLNSNTPYWLLVQGNGWHKYIQIRTK